ncbi:hypothetical protein SEA_REDWATTLEHOG_67 [Gordonia phage RedWattleHog]|uniref:Uncharacterized protein n=1 Tax=Gordonia phage Stormageddon TaxID=2656541 RepID=A0A649VR00_9CAUD|nr:hypothetical protein KHQ86_gp064 [Gordonia phage Stormageddon]QGJ94927.1 hypothetical protein SEA_STORMAGEDDON_64 [Gordonia phage Stormageddon]QLF83571.1 hypothetical protein SEA_REDWATTLEHOG_67 [Gordonia phage RedWattleHog]
MSGVIVTADTRVADMVYFDRTDREGWYEADCLFIGCDWHASGTESNVEEAAYDHVQRVHPVENYIGRHRR